MSAKNKKHKKLPLRDSSGKFVAKSAPVVVAPSSDTADSLRVVTQGLSALLTQIKIDRQNARRRVLTPKEKDLRRDRAKASLPGLEDEIKVLEQTLKKFATLDSYKKYIEEQKVEAKKEKDKTKYQDAAESKFESGDFIGGMLFKWLGRNEPKKGDLKKEEEEKQLIEERRKLQDTLYGLQEREAQLQRQAGVTPTPIAPEAPAAPAEAARPEATATPAATAEAPTPIAPEAPAAPAEAARPEAQIQAEDTRVKAEQIHTEAEKQTTIIQRTSDGIDKLWTEPINVNATVIDFSDPALKKLVTKLKDEGIGTGGGGGGLGDILSGLGGAAAGTALSKGTSEVGGSSLLGKVSKVGKAAPIIGGVLTAGLGLMQGDSIAKAGSKGVGTTVGSIAGAALGTLGGPLAPVLVPVLAIIGGMLGDVLGGLFGDFLDSLGTIFKNDRKPPPDDPQKPPQVGQKNNVTLAELTESGLNIKQGAMAEGATVSENVKAGANKIMNFKQLGTSSKPNQITSLNDDFHKEFEHPKGNAFDFTVMDKPSEEEGQAIIKQIVANDSNVSKVIDEYNHPSTKSNGGHFHVEYKSDEPKAEFIGPPAAPAKPSDTPVTPAPTKDTKQEAPPTPKRSGSPSPTPQSRDQNLFNTNQESYNQGVTNENEKFNTATMTASRSTFPATPSAPVLVPNQGPQQATQLYGKARDTDIIKDKAQAKQVQSVVVLQDNSSKSSTTSSQKEARDHFLPMPNYFYNVDGTSCAC